MQLLSTRLWGRHSDIGIYQRLKASRLFDLYFGLRNRAVLDKRDAELAFYRALLRQMRPGEVIYDIGANMGDKSELFLRLGARVVAVDPDTTNQAILEHRFHKYRLHRKPVEVVCKAVSDRTGTQTFWVDEAGSAKNTLASKWVTMLRSDRERFGRALSFDEQRQVESITLDDMFRQHGTPFFIKIDVEGHEPSVLSASHEAVPYVQFEVNLPEFLDEGLRCVELLQQLDPQSRFALAPSLTADGIAPDVWMGGEPMRQALRDCQKRSIEVFCRSPAALSRRDLLPSLPTSAAQS